MSETMTRRDFVKAGSTATAAFLGTVPLVHAGGQEATLKIGLVGCGGRGTGAAENCLRSSPNVQLTALADMFPDRLANCRKQLSDKEGYKVSDETAFSGWDSYLKLIQSGVDLVLLATPPGFRPLMFEAAVAAGKHVFMEKPCAVDPVGCRKVIEIGKKAEAAKLGVLAGTQYRHQESFISTVRQIHEEGLIGEIVSGRAYYNAGTLWSKEREEGQCDMEWMIRNWLYFDWLSGDHFVEQHIHTIDVTDWVMGARPVRAVGTGGRQVRVEEVYGNIYDHFTIDYEYPKGRHVMSMARQMAGTANQVGAYFVGTKGEADVYGAVIRNEKGEVVWKHKDKPNIGRAYVQEHADLIASIRNGKPLNDAERVAGSTLTAIMGREAAYTGKLLTWEEMEKSDLELAPTKLDKLEKGPVPIRPVPLPGKSR